MYTVLALASPLLLAAGAAPSPAAAPKPKYDVQLTTRTEQVPLPADAAAQVELETFELHRAAAPGVRDGHHVWRLPHVRPAATAPQKTSAPLEAWAQSLVPRHEVEAEVKELRSFYESDPGDRTGNLADRVEVVVNRKPWLALDVCSSGSDGFGWTDCTQSRLRVDTGEVWSWLDGIKVETRRAFLDACKPFLRKAQAKQRVVIGETQWNEVQSAYGAYPVFSLTCTPEMFADAHPTADGGLRLVAGGLPHAVQALDFTFELPGDLVRANAAPGGPLAPGPAAKAPTKASAKKKTR